MHRLSSWDEVKRTVNEASESWQLMEKFLWWRSRDTKLIISSTFSDRISNTAYMRIPCTIMKWRDVSRCTIGAQLEDLSNHSWKNIDMRNTRRWSWWLHLYSSCRKIVAFRHQIMFQISKDQMQARFLVVIDWILMETSAEWISNLTMTRTRYSHSHVGIVLAKCYRRKRQNFERLIVSQIYFSNSFSKQKNTIRNKSEKYMRQV